MSNRPLESPESMAIEPVVRSTDESFKRWLAVLIAFVTLLVSLATFLHADASKNAATLTRLAQANAIDSTGAQTRGQVELAFDEFVIAREYDELYGTRVRLADNGETLAANGYITASREITTLTPALGPNYTTTDANGLRSTNFNGYQADTWVVTATLLSQRREAAAAEGNDWGNKANNYVAAIAVFAVSLFLLGLATTFSGLMRWLFSIVGLMISLFALLGMLWTWIVPIHHIPDNALQQYAHAYGLEWQYQYANAIQLYSDAIKIDPAYANAYARRGISASYLNPPQVQDAIRDLEQARRLGGEKYNVYWDLGWEYYLAGDYAKSIPLSQTSLALNTKVCGPAFNIAIAKLASGQIADADKSYADAISRCEKIYEDSIAAGLGAPSSLWRDMSASADDIENLLCQTYQKYCYPNRDKPDVSKVAKSDAFLASAEKYRVRIKEAVTALEFLGTTAVKPTGAKFDPLAFANKTYDTNGSFKAYDTRVHFPKDGDPIYAIWNYSAMTKGMKLTWKVYVDGAEDVGLRYDEDWTLEANGKAEKKINSWYILEPGRYDVEVYGDGELLSSGSFVIDEK